MRDPLWEAVRSFGLEHVALPRGRQVSTAQDPARPSPPSLAEDMKALEESVAGCRRCRLSEGRNRLVFGAGNPASGILLVGEGPGANEDVQGIPFVGRAGELLDRILAAISLDRNSVYIANVVKCRPPENRTPAPDEVGMCMPVLERQIGIMKPGVIVALGASAASALLGGRQGIGVLRGTMHRYGGIPVMVTYHPAALLRSPALKRPVWEDMKKLSSFLAVNGLPRHVTGS